MKGLRLWIVLLVLILSAQANAQIETTSSRIDTVMAKEFGSEMEDDSVFVDSSDLVDNEDDNSLQVRAKGFLDTYHAVRVNSKYDWMSSRTRARGELMLEKGSSSLYLSLNATYNALLKQRTGLELREAYLSYAKGNVDMRVGRQIVVWGVADALRLTDCVSPFDYTEFLAQDYDDIRIPVNGLRMKYMFNSITFEAICIPIADFFVFPTDERNPWAFRLSSTALPYKFDFESGKPEKRLSNMEFGGRVSVNLSGVDFSISALRTWNKMPALATRLSADRDMLLLNGHYRRMTMLGADCSLPLGQFVVRTEAACYLDEAQTASLGHDVAQRNSLNALIGLDWFPGNDWNISAQYYHKYTSGNIEGLATYRNAGLATTRISKELLRNTLKLSTFAYVDVTNGGVFNRLSATYSLNDQIELTAGYDFFSAEKGKFVMYKNNSEVWIKAKYNF